MIKLIVFFISLQVFGDTPTFVNYRYNNDVCVIDKTTDLMWEVKSSKTNVQNSFNSYTWFDVKTGVENGINSNKCNWGSFCNTQRYIRTINNLQLCGFSNWRLPTANELKTLIRYLDEEPTINHKFFPNTEAGLYWSSTVDADDIGVLDVPFFYGGFSGSGKEFDSFVRLVRDATKIF